MFYSSKLKLAFLCLTILFCHNTLLAQDIIPFGLYFNNWKMVNPASAGLSEAQEFNIAYRANNTKVDSHPSYVLLSYEDLLSRQNSGLGIIFENQQIRARTRVFGKAIYNYQIRFGRENTVSFGAGFGFLSETYDLSSLRYVDLNDPALVTNSSPSNAFDLELGVAFRSKNFQGGISLKNLLESKIENPHFDLLKDNTVQHLTAYGEYRVAFDKFRFIPSIYVNTDYENVLLDLNPTVEILNFLLIGGTLRISNNDNIMNVNAGVNWNNKVQLFGVVYSSGYEGEGNNFEFSLSIRIDQN